MLRSDLMLESACPELSPLMNRPESACCSRCKRGRGGTDNNNDNESDEEVKAMAESESETKALAKAKAKAREEGGAKGEKCAAKGQKGNIERNVSTSSAYCCWKQVEINTIASGFGHLGPASKTIQRCLLSLSLTVSLTLYIHIHIPISLSFLRTNIYVKTYIYIYPALFTHRNEPHCLYMPNQSHSHTHTYTLTHTYIQTKPHIHSRTTTHVKVVRRIRLGKFSETNFGIFHRIGKNP